MWTLAVAVVAVVVAVVVVVVAVVELPHGLTAVVICKTEGILVIVPNPLEIFLEDRENGKPVNKTVKGNARKDRVNGRGNAAKEPISVKGNAAKDRVNGSSRLAIANRTVKTLLTIIAMVTGVVAVGTVAVITSPRVGVGWV
jgi:hypothetical protein